MPIETINPATDEVTGSYPEVLNDDISLILGKTQEAFIHWRKTSFSERSKRMKMAAGILRAKQETYAKLITTEMGKPLAQARAENAKCAWCCDFYAQNAEKFLSSQMVKTDARKSYVSFQPLGIVLAVMPWNFPFWQVFRFLVPALMAGNAGVLKHASNVPGCALAIEGIFQEAGFPENLFRTLLIESRQVDFVIENPLVKAVTLTGSTPAGKAVAAKAGSCLKKTVLELGGSDPYIILKDADLDKAVSLCVTSRLLNSGQSCIAAKRFIVVKAIESRFTEILLDVMKAVKMGDPLDEKTDIGPLARHDLRDQLHHQVQQSIAQGAKLLLGGTIPEKKGAYYPPTILTDVNKWMPAYDEELFGPVASIISVKDEREAIEVANDTVFGLGAAVFTKDVQHGEHIAVHDLEAGSCFVNDYVKSDPRLPFGGIKGSGYGRELSSFGIREFVNIKTVYVK